jgi:hypothetical protein
MSETVEATTTERGGLRAIKGGKRPMSHADATARVRAINRELGVLNRQREALIAERDWAMAEQERHVRESRPQQAP